MNKKSPTESMKTTIRYLVILNIFCFMALMLGQVFMNKALEGITVSFPPDLRHGGLLVPGSKTPEDVFAFAWVNYSAVQSWPDNGAVDYDKKIKALSPFFTTDFKNQLINDLKTKKKRGELNKVQRKLSLPAKYVYGDDSVSVIDSNTWVVYLPAEILEYTNNVVTKDIEVLYSLVVRRMRSDIQNNVFQLGIDSFAVDPIRTKDRLSKSVIKQDTDALIKIINNGVM